MNLFVIPGNPPAMYFYEKWGEEWLKKFPDHTFNVSSYSLLDRDSDSHRFMNKVLQVHLENFLKYQSSCNQPLVLIGHSLGAYFAQKICETCPDKVLKCVFVHPFLRKPKKSGRLILKSISIASQWPKFESLLISRKNLLEGLVKDLSVVSQEESQMSLRLATHEARSIMIDNSKLIIDNNITRKFHLFYTHNDRWCTHKVVKELENQISAQKVDTSHDFVRYKSERDIMSHELKHLLRL